ncbi:MAG TPA: ATP-binding cassette domain-containing protein, partial [Burkholderiaceae bacterium]|nr:ATP-binding cassette domain-containing protein [Burkholderiaceae bacterium]
GGEQQMVAIGRALMAKPRLLLLDEPFTGLSMKMKRIIFDAIRAWDGSEEGRVGEEGEARRAAHN